MKVVYIYRKRRTEHFSIESLFYTVSKKIGLKLKAETKNFTLPFFSNGILKRIANIFSVLSLKADVYHITGDINYVCLFLPKKRTVLTIHDCCPLAFEKSIKGSIYRLLWLKLPAMQVRLITTVSQKTKKDLIDICGIDDKKIVVIDNFVSKEYFECKKNTEDLKTRELISIGTKNNKNILRVLEAIRETDYTLNIVGPLNDEIKNKCVSLSIKYNNYVNITNDEIIKIYLKSDALLFASTFEGFGLPIIEGQALKVPVITSNIEPMNYISGNGAILVDPFSVESIVDGIKKLDDNELIRKKINIGYNNALKYNVDNICDKYFKVYESLNEDIINH